MGIAGVDGNGQSELTLALAGVLRPESGKILLVRSASTKRACANAWRWALV